MLHSLEMPSFLAEDAIPPTAAANGSHTSFHHRKSVERTHSSTGSYRDGDKRVNGEVNGMNGNGSPDAMYHPNGHRTSSERKGSMENGGPVEPVARRSR